VQLYTGNTLHLRSTHLNKHLEDRKPQSHCSKTFTPKSRPTPGYSNVFCAKAPRSFDHSIFSHLSSSTPATQRSQPFLLSQRGRHAGTTSMRQGVWQTIMVIELRSVSASFHGLENDEHTSGGLEECLPLIGHDRPFQWCERSHLRMRHHLWIYVNWDEVRQV
jgi:hypothetical protein